MNYGREERSIGELFSELTHETQKLLRQELELAKIEVSQKVTRLMRDITFLAIGVFVAYAAFLALVATVIIALGTAGVAWWLAALVVTLVLAGITYSLIQKGLHDIRREDLTPHQTLDTLKEDKKWVKERM